METPTEEQLRDPKWWDENAGTASHYCVRNKQFYDSRLHPCCYERPTKPAAPEWDGEGLPPVGCECEVSFAGYWVKAKVIHSTASGILVSEMFGRFPGKVHISVDPSQFRPIRTKEQLEREELVSAAIKACPYPGSSQTRIDVEALYDAGMLRKAGDQ